MAAPAPPDRLVHGVFAIGYGGDGGAAAATFRDQFGAPPRASSDGWAITASHSIIGERASLWSLGTPLFWDKRRGDYASIATGAALDALAPAVRAGSAWPAFDDCILFRDREGWLFFASGAGATTLYVVEHRGHLLIANRPQAIAAARSARLDRLGLGEIVRFGANYGQRTILQDVRRIPIGHVTELAAGKPPRTRAYIDYSHRPDHRRDAAETRAAIGAALDRNLALIDGPRDLLFSGGVDSALLALRGAEAGTISKGWFYAVGRDDPELAIARDAAATIGIELASIQDQTTSADIVERVGAYALPTLDFSIIPTFALGSAILAASGPTTLVDGTGGDAWFGFGSLAHVGSWSPLHRLRALSPLARSAYCAALPWESSRALRPLKGLARTPRRASAALGHMCANPVYSALLDLNRDEWLAIEDEALALLRSLTGGALGSPMGEVIVSDACLIAVAQFAAKTGQWSHAGKAATAYPFLMPNMVEIGRTMPARLLMRDGQAKPLLKDMVAASPLGRAFAYRRKSGFQPPLQALLQEDGGQAVLSVPRDAEEAPWTATARELPARLLRDKNSLRIGGLYAIWSRLVIEFWLKSLRQ
ncbi:asparagine synthase-related protein [Qipengyuania sediminis]|uniref:asparagine synthase-related protein n=1 Tax=Qipengyuania sediminis TaxID=1532023 RepID=UPI001059ACB2|nr:asparagine synthase-related protein [Qipengyuania sediminis]